MSENRIASRKRQCPGDPANRVSQTGQVPLRPNVPRATKGAAPPRLPCPRAPTTNGHADQPDTETPELAAIANPAGASGPVVVRSSGGPPEIELTGPVDIFSGRKLAQHILQALTDAGLASEAPTANP